jgi:hypothetical protein
MTQTVTAMEASKDSYVRLIRRREYTKPREARFSPRERERSHSILWSLVLALCANIVSKDTHVCLWVDQVAVC